MRMDQKDEINFKKRAIMEKLTKLISSSHSEL